MRFVHLDPFQFTSLWLLLGALRVSGRWSSVYFILSAIVGLVGSLR